MPTDIGELSVSNRTSDCKSLTVHLVHYNENYRSTYLCKKNGKPQVREDVGYGDRGIIVYDQDETIIATGNFLFDVTSDPARMQIVGDAKMGYSIIF